ncbi:MAG: BatA and WFA domain-containing protein [Phycisphaerales bacterium]|nr:BatA and WFA domain-containing protein [Phycisphaerales bacterium]
MTWLTPLAGAILAAAVVPPLVLLYFLRLRRSSAPIASTLLWQRSVEDLTANAPFQRLRFGILLMLQLLALAMLAIAIMQPRLEAQKRDGGRTVFLIDNSASMTATDNEDDETRLDVAKSRARSLVEKMYAGGFMADAPGETMIIAFSGRAEVVSRFTDSKTALLNAIDRIQPTHGESSLAEALQLARAYTTNVNPDQQDRPMDDPATIELFSDGRIQDLDDQVLRGEALNYHAIGSTEADNVGIAAVSVDRPYDRPTAVEVFASIINYNPVEIPGCEVQLSIDGTGVGVQEITLRPAEVDEDGVIKPARNNLVFLPFEQPRGAVIEVAIVRNDDLIADNIANVVLPPARQLKVALVEPKSRVLSFALEGLNLSDHNFAMTGEELEALIADDNIDAYDVYFLDNYAPKAMTAGRFVTFGVTPPVEGLNPYGEGKAQVVLDSDTDHPTMRYVTFDNIFVSTSTLLEPARDVRVIIEGSEGPLMVEVLRGPLALIHVTFDPLESNMPLLRSFPTWVYNVVDYLGHIGESVASQSGKPGEAVTVRVPASAQDVRIELPNGTTETLTPSETNEVSWGPARLAGVYEVTWDEPEAEGRVRRDFAVNLLSDREGDIVPRETLIIGSTVTKGDLGTRAAYTPLWPWAVGVCLMLMMTEWWIFHRRARI